MESKRVNQIIGGGEEMKVDVNGITYIATELDGEFQVNAHNGMMPKHWSVTVGTLAELAAAMREIASIRNWRTRPVEDYA